MSNESSSIPLQIEIVCLNSVRSLPGTAQVLSELERERKFSLKFVRNFAEIESTLGSEKSFLVLLSSASSVELTACLQWLQARRAPVGRAKTKVVVFNLLAHPKVGPLLLRQGSQDVIDARMSSKVIDRKLKSHIQSLVVSESRSLQETENEMPSSRETTGKAGSALREREIAWDNPLDCMSDCWLITDPSLIKFVMGRWMLMVLGPGPSAGKWERATSDHPDRLYWDWKPRKLDQDPFILESGVWTYCGREPEFVWKFNLWRFVGEQPSLIFRAASNKVHNRFVTSPEKITICKNSAYADSKRDLIRESIEASLQIRGAKSGPTEESVFEEEIRRKADKDYRLEMPENKGPLDFREEKVDSKMLSFIHRKEEGSEKNPWASGSAAFKRIEFAVRLKELNVELQLISFEGQEATFSASANLSLSLEQSLGIEVKVNEVTPGDGSRKSMEDSFLVGKVKRIEPWSGDGQELVFEIPREGSKIFETIAAIVRSRQSEILSFFNLARGV